MTIPRPGQVWRFGGPDGRLVTITSISRALKPGSYSLMPARNPQVVYKTRFYVAATPSCITQPVRSFLTNFHYAGSL